nr:cytochrome c oxidase subunit II [Amylibacter cionae]
MASGAAMAQNALPDLPTLGKPEQDGLNFQQPATELMRDVIWMDTFLLWIITIISVFVTALLLYCLFRYNEKRNKVPATFTHNSLLEVAWTVVPILVLIAIIPPSLTLLFKQQEIPEADITIKATGNQWYWTHEYVDHDFGFDSFMLPREELAENGFEDDEYLLATDTSVVIPTGKTVVVQVTGADVIHSWTIPAFGVKQDAVPGRLAQLWFEVDEGKEGVYFGQCSELCGKDHSYMPITVKAVSQADYDAWLEGAIEEYAGTPSAVTVADLNMKMVQDAQAAE